MSGPRCQKSQAAELLEDALGIVVDGGARYFEMWVRPDLARARAETGRLEQARLDLERSRKITARGEDWRGRTGHVELAEALVLAFEDRTDEADAHFSDALRTLRRYKLHLDEAEALHLWGRSLARAGDDAGAAAKLGGALEIYGRHGAGAPWLNRIDADMRRLRTGSPQS
jgi:tetratricopeptide (TPR) repeat protein